MTGFRPSSPAMRRMTVQAFAVIAGSAVVLGVLLAVLANTSDLRGWPAVGAGTARAPFAATTPQGSEFTLAACWSPSIDLYALPNSRESVATATETVVACRSRNSLFVWVGVHLLLTVSALGLVLFGRFRRSGASRA